MWLVLDNLTAQLNNATTEETIWLNSFLAFSDSSSHFRQGKTKDQKIQLYNANAGLFPAGLTGLVMSAARERGFTVSLLDKRTAPLTPLTGQALDEALYWLRDYQREAVDAMILKTRGIVSATTGSGKTEIITGLARACPGTWLMIVHNKKLMHDAALRYELREHQWWLKKNVHPTDFDPTIDRRADEAKVRAEIDKLGLSWGEVIKPAGLVGDGHWHSEKFTFCTFQTLARALRVKRGVVQNQKAYDKAKALLNAANGVMIDECFPAGTLVGGVPIEQLKIGDIVPSYCTTNGVFCRRSVVKLYKNKPRGLVQVTLESGKELVCTPNHKLWTKTGWVSADSVCELHVLHSTAYTRVVSVKVLKQESDGEYGGLCPQGVVYNIEVEGTHTYVANGVVVSNCHVCAADSFWGVVQAAENAYYRVGFSGTPLARGDRRSVLAVAALGPVQYKIDAIRLQQEGVLAKPRIRMFDCYQIMPDTSCSRCKGSGDGGMGPSTCGLCNGTGRRAPQWRTVQTSLITKSKKRNKLIVDIIKRYAKRPVLVFVEAVEHGKILETMLMLEGISSVFTWGKDSSDSREAAINQLINGEVEVLIASRIFQEGVDISSIRCVVMASGGKSIIAALQKIGRGMRIDEDKTEFDVFEIRDYGHKWLDRHTKQRVKAYTSEGHTVINEGTLLSNVP